MDDKGNIYEINKENVGKNIDTGEEKKFSDKMLKLMKMIPIKELKQVKKMNRHERRKWYKQHK